MRPKDQSGSILTIATIVILSLVLIGTAIFAVTAYNDKQKYKNESDKLVAAAVDQAKQQQSTELQAQFAQDSKKPFKTFKGPVALGSISFRYPRTWSAYVDQTDTSQPINGYFHPDAVPGLESGTALALRVELLDTGYSDTLAGFDSQLETGDVKAEAYIPPKLAKVKNVQAGTLLSGNITEEFQGQMLVIKVRDKTLQLSTQSQDFADDFTGTVLKSLKFNP